MKLILHAGHHKTGTSTFQKMCTEKSNNMSEAGVFFPVMDGKGNMSRAYHFAQKGDWTVFENIFKKSNYYLKHIKCLLISAEDLENCLIEHDIAAELIRRAEIYGFNEVEWILVQRDPFEYSQSLYAQLSRDRQILRYDMFANQILKDGFFTANAPHFRWHFVFDYARFLSDFLEKVSSNVSVMKFENFISGIPGKDLLHKCGLPEDFISQHFEQDAGRRENIRRDETQVEFNYISRFLGVEPTAENFERHKSIVQELIRVRLQLKKQADPIYKFKFQERFSWGCDCQPTAPSF